MLAQPRRWRLLANTLGIALAVVLNTACSGKSFELLLEKNCTNTGSPPTRPADLAAANAGGGAIRLTWQASKDDTTPQASMVYEICQTTTSGGCSGGSFSVTYSVTGQTKYTTGALTNGTTYFFTIRARDAECNVSAVSPQVRATAATTPQWQQTAYLKAPNAEANDWFGYSVAISGDTIVVGAYSEDSNSTAVCNAPNFATCNNNLAGNAGAAYVFERDGSGAWQQKAYLKAPNTGANDYFGYSVAISGDTIVVGAYGEASNSTQVCNEFTSTACDNAGGDGPNNNGASDAGAAYVFERNGSGAWQQKAYLKAPNAEASDNFGWSVAISGDTIVVGAYQEASNSTAVCNEFTSTACDNAGMDGPNNNGAGGAGAAYVFERDGSGAWQQKAYLKAPNAEGNDQFGISVAVSGDTIVVGAYWEDSNSTAVMNYPFGLFSEGATDAGAAYVFERDGSGAWQQKAYLKAPNAQASDNFGWSVAISGDTIVVGAYGEASNSTAVCNEFTSTACDNAGGNGPDNNGAGGAGAAYVFEHNGSGAWQQKAYLKAPNTGAGDLFGISVAISGDTIVVGANLEDSTSTAVCNDLMSCPGMGNNMATDSGAAYVFERDGSGNWQQKAYLKAPNTGAGDYFGSSVAISGDTIVVGAYQEASNSTAVCNAPFSGNCTAPGGLYMGDNSAGNAGAAYVFERK
jgi:hypothetical protein